MIYGFIKANFPDTPFSFTKGLLANLNKTSLPIEPFENYVKVIHGKTIEDIDNWFIEKNNIKTGSLWGQLGHCYKLIYWASGGLYWSNELNSKDFNGPKEFTIHCWEQLDKYNLKSIHDIAFKDVKWLNVQHADNNGSSDCWGLASFSYKEKLISENYKPKICNIPTTIQYPSLYYDKLLIKYENFTS